MASSDVVTPCSRRCRRAAETSSSRFCRASERIGRSVPAMRLPPAPPPWRLRGQYRRLPPCSVTGGSLRSAGQRLRPHHDHERTTVATSVPLSLLDLARVRPSEAAAEGVARSVRLARTADDLGYHRLWVSEHHTMPGLASSATSLYIQHLTANTRNMRVGSGG